MLRGREHSTGLDLKLLITAREWENLSVFASDSAPCLGRTPWDEAEEIQAGKEYRLWPSEERWRFIKRIELNDAERNTVIERVGEQVGTMTAERLRREEEWAFLWIKEDSLLEGTQAQGQRGWYCVWPNGWSVEIDIEEREQPNKESTIGQSYLDNKVDNSATGPMKPADSVARFLAALRSDAPAHPPPDAKEIDFEILTDLGPPTDGLPSLFDTQSWLDYDPVLDMASEMADTPTDLAPGAPTPLGRTDPDQAAPVNHDSVDAISSKILSPTANPTPAAQRDWDMIVTAYEMAQNEDVITETDFNFFDAPHRSMFDAFDDEIKDEEMRYDLDDQGDKGNLAQPDDGKGSWVDTADPALLEPDPAPPYTAKAIQDPPAVMEETIELAFDEEPMELAREGAELEDDSDDLFGEKEDDSDDRTSEQELQAEHTQSGPGLEQATVFDVDLKLSSDFATVGSETVRAQTVDSIGSYVSALDSTLPAPKLTDLIDVRYAIDNTRGAFVAPKHSPLKWTSSRSKTLMRTAKGGVAFLLKGYGDGMVKDRKGHRSRLRKTLSTRRWSSAYETADIATDSDSGVEVSDNDSDDSWMLYEADANHSHKNQTSAGPTKVMQRFELGAQPWICPDIVRSSRYTRPPAVAPMTTYLLPASSASTATAVSTTGTASALKRGFREWLASLVVEDPALRQSLLGRSRSPHELPRSRESLDVRVRVGHCGRSTEMDGNSVRFWKQLGLTPFSGQKDISVFVVFDSAYTDMSEAMDLQSELDQAYQVSCLAESVKVVF